MLNSVLWVCISGWWLLLVGLMLSVLVIWCMFLLRVCVVIMRWLSVREWVGMSVGWEVKVLW